MSDIKPRDSHLLTHLDIDYAPFNCCGDEDLVFLRCAHCGHVWVECYECSTWYVDLHDLSKRESACLSDVRERLSCPDCKTAFADFFYLKEGNVDRYLATAKQVMDAGYGQFLASHLRENGPST